MIIPKSKYIIETPFNYAKYLTFYSGMFEVSN